MSCFKQVSFVKYENDKNGLLKFAEKTDEYLSDNELVSVEGLCNHLGITRKTLSEWQKKRSTPWKFIIEFVKERILAQKKQNAFKGLISYRDISFDLASNYNYEPVSIKKLKEDAEHQAKSEQRENTDIDDIINNLKGEDNE